MYVVRPHREYFERLGSELTSYLVYKNSSNIANFNNSIHMLFLILLRYAFQARVYIYIFYTYMYIHIHMQVQVFFETQTLEAQDLPKAPPR